jgi:hypothetical protein
MRITFKRLAAPLANRRENWEAWNDLGGERDRECVKHFFALTQEVSILHGHENYQSSA